MSGASHRIRRLEREVQLLRALVHSSPTAKLAEQLVAEAEGRCQKRLRRVRKKLLLVCHPDKCGNLTRKQLSELFTRTVSQILDT